MTMRMNGAGLALIMAFEGWREKAYRDAVGVWTIGYGHTSMAGAPEVKRGMVITKAEGAEILRRDVDLFARGVTKLLTVTLNDNQFSALVSFAYNVGLGNFKKSSVLKAVNASNFQLVPHRLMLWNKADGRVLTGLTRRRKAEGDLFVKRPEAKQVEFDNPNPPADVVQHAEHLEPKSVTTKPSGKAETAAGGAGAVVVSTGAAAAALGFPWERVLLIGGCALLAIAIVVLILKLRKLP